MFAVLPMLMMAGFFIWGGIAVLGVVFDSWANRPVKKAAPRYRDDV